MLTAAVRPKSANLELVFSCFSLAGRDWSLGFPSYQEKSSKKHATHERPRKSLGKTGDRSKAFTVVEIWLETLDRDRLLFYFKSISEIVIF